MYKIITFAAFSCCIFWLYIDPSPEPVVVLLLAFAGFFRDDIHGVIGKNVFTLTPKTKLIRDLDLAKYSFTSTEFINPRILEDLLGWISDLGDQIVSINITGSNNSNRYSGHVTYERFQEDYPVVTSKYDDCWFSYKYLGRSFTGVHLILTWSNTGGAGIFCNILLATLSTDSAFEYDYQHSKKHSRFLIKLVGAVPLGDRYGGDISYKFGILKISKCHLPGGLQNPGSKLLVL